MPRRALALPLTLCALLAALTLARLPAAWQSGNALNHVGGAWMALADDLAHGTFYRPLQDPRLGYGGTRNFPLVFALHAGLLRAGVPLLPAGYAVAAAAGLLAVLGVALLLRRAGLGRAEAALLAAAALAGGAAQRALTANRGDLWPVALTALGLAALLGAGRWRLPLAALLLSLAFAAKMTALTGLAAGVAFLALRRERVAAVRLLGLGGGLGLLWLALAELLSGGRFLTTLAACASGGADLRSLLGGPARVLFHLRFADRAGLALLAAAVTALLAARPREPGGWRAPESAVLLLGACWLALAVGAAAVVFGSPGTATNHFVELEVASAAVLGAALARAVGAGPARQRVAVAAAALAAVTGLASAGLDLRQDRRESRLAQVRAAIALLPPGARVLSEDPLVPLLAGQRPLALDSWMLRLLDERDPAFAAPLVAALQAGQVPAVVLFEPIEHPDLAGPNPRHLGTPVVQAIAGSFRPAGQAGRYHLYTFAGRPAPLVQPVGPTPRPAPAGGATGL
ncbi:MAG: hypothetical protein QM767_23205 [Anaeromyxobacter sp.]